MELTKQYTCQILTLHATSSFTSEMVRRWQPCCSVVKPCSYESTQNSALFHLKLIKSTQHLYDTLFNWLKDSVSESVVLLLQNCTIFGVSSLHNNLSSHHNNSLGVQGWRSGESTRLHQCGSGSIPRSGVKCGLSLLVLFSAPRGFLRVLRFPLSSKTKIWLDCVNC